jgi:hypothetical protein
LSTRPLDHAPAEHAPCSPQDKQRDEFCNQRALYPAGGQEEEKRQQKYQSDGASQEAVGKLEPVDLLEAAQIHADVDLLVFG